MSNPVTLALPSKGAIADPTQEFFRNSGMKVVKPNPRQYTGTIPSLPGVSVLFQRVKDVLYKVGDGTAQLGVTGYDVVCEHPNDNIVVIHEALGYGHCELVVAVPESWVDVENIYDLSEVALHFRDNKGRNLRIATTYTHQARQFLHHHEIHHFSLVKADGAIEAAPTIGYADIVIDLTQTGTTLRENHLKLIKGGTILSSQACLIGNKQALLSELSVLSVVKRMLEYIDAATNARGYIEVSANIEADHAETIAQLIHTNPVSTGLQGPNISPLYSQSATEGFTVTVVIESRNLLNVIDHMRSVGGQQILVKPVQYIFLDKSQTYAKLLETLGLSD